MSAIDSHIQQHPICLHGEHLSLFLAQDCITESVRRLIHTRPLPFTRVCYDGCDVLALMLLLEDAAAWSLKPYCLV